MTNVESHLQKALKKRDNDELNSWENDFVSQFEGYSKKRLYKLTSKQFLKLRDIANN